MRGTVELRNANDGTGIRIRRNIDVINDQLNLGVRRYDSKPMHGDVDPCVRIQLGIRAGLLLQGLSTSAGLR